MTGEHEAAIFPGPVKRLINVAAAGVWGVLALVIGVNIADEIRGRRLQHKAEQRTRAGLVVPR